MTKPIIGIIPLYDEYKESLWMVPGYMDMLEENGAVPIMFPLTNNEETLKEVYNLCSGILFTGGHDVNPSLYNEEKKETCGKCCIKRDNMEQIILKWTLRDNKSLLGICRGIQLLNALLGGNLYQDLNSEYSLSIDHHQCPPYDKSVHEVDIIKDTMLYDILKTNKINVNSYHHQGIKTLSNSLRATAISTDNLIEGAYVKDKKFILGVQWHPEFNYKKEDSSVKLIQAFIKSTKEA